LKRLVSAATGASAERNDEIEIVAADFAAGEGALAPEASPGMRDYMLMNAGTAINAMAFLGVAFLVVWFGVRPMTRMLAQPQAATALEASAVPTTALESMPGVALSAPGANVAAIASDRTSEGARTSAQIEGPRRQKNMAMREKLEAIVESDSAEVTKVLKGWMQNPKGA
jgi:flagellar M-ring protein FliF